MKEQLLTSNQAVECYSPNKVFWCPEESQFYSQCLEKMVLNNSTPVDRIIEFGTGDGSPVINSLLKTRFSGCIHGYELNREACKIARSRIEEYGLQDRYVIHNQCFFKNIPSNVTYSIANPPYLPAPDNNLYMPSLHGGKDGATITKRLFSIGSENVMLMLSAYSNPVETVERAIALGYQVIDFSISPLKFGYYSCEPKVKNAIEQLRRNGQAFYSQNIYFLAGVLFKKKDDYNLDISTELLKVMTAL
ncbi:MAG: SAM-dependent methyltransferase [Cyanosarcina radialis HA8281-LM2]|jgi:methylase of polypeptide subunit release factors|nr:SAM-dependent methyltransferase [Cyanosarcina radialis HA8281-LM2]